MIPRNIFGNTKCDIEDDELKTKKEQVTAIVFLSRTDDWFMTVL